MNLRIHKLQVAALNADSLRELVIQDLVADARVVEVSVRGGFCAGTCDGCCDAAGACTPLATTSSTNCGSGESGSRCVVCGNYEQCADNACEAVSLSGVAFDVSLQELFWECTADQSGGCELIVDIRPEAGRARRIDGAEDSDTLHPNTMLLTGDAAIAGGVVRLSVIEDDDPFPNDFLGACEIRVPMESLLEAATDRLGSARVVLPCGPGRSRVVLRVVAR